MPSNLAVKPEQGSNGEVFDTEKYILFVPEREKNAGKMPLVVCFSSTGDAKGFINIWRDIASRLGIAVIASKEFRNEVMPGKAFTTISDFVVKEADRYSIDQAKVIVTGFSGGGMAAHMFSVGNKVLGVISNSGRIHPDFLGKDSHYYPKTGLAVFIASPQDYNYNYMKGDKYFLDKLGWKTKWIEFKGGHNLAPGEKYEEAVQWLLSK